MLGIHRASNWSEQDRIRIDGVVYYPSPARFESIIMMLRSAGIYPAAKQTRISDWILPNPGGELKQSLIQLWLGGVKHE